MNTQSEGAWSKTDEPRKAFLLYVELLRSARVDLPFLDRSLTRAAKLVYQDRPSSSEIMAG
jgi:hypothetical protein